MNTSDRTRRWLLVGMFLIPCIIFSQSMEQSLNLGVELYGAGKLQESIQELQNALTMATSVSQKQEVLYWLSLAELFNGEYKNALTHSKNLIALDPTGKRAIEALYTKGRSLYYTGQYDEAIITFNNYMQQVTDSGRKSSALYWIGECLFSLGQFEEAKKTFSIIIYDYPQSPKYEASSYRVALIDQKKIEQQLLLLLKWSHQESLKIMEEYQRREKTYEQAIEAYQRRIAEMLKDTHLSDLEKENEELKIKIAELETKLADQEAASNQTENSNQVLLEQPSMSGISDTSIDQQQIDRLLSIKAKALELQKKLQLKLPEAETQNSTGVPK
jgi:tetratricopeptide (TPR) repeat protein